MTRIVNLYLLVTGGLAALVLMMPWLVILGAFLLILPGLILGLAPTAFMWGLGFAIPWYALRIALGDYLAIVPAAAIAAAFFWLVPQSSIVTSKARLAQSVKPELIPSQPIGLSGNILLSDFSMTLAKQQPNTKFDREELAQRPYICNALCAALLATPGVTSVTVNSNNRAEEGNTPLTPHARTFRVVPKSQCPRPSVRPTTPDELGLVRGGSSRERIRQAVARPLQAEWDVRLSTTDCIVAEPPRTEYDFIIRKHSYHAFEKESPGRPHWSLRPLAVWVDRLDVTDGAGRMLLSKTSAWTRSLVAPLLIAPEGGLENFAFQWGRKRLSNGNSRYSSWNANQLLADHTTLRTEVDFAKVMQASRDRLAHALADPSLPSSDPAFQLAGPWFHSLAGQEVTADDRALAARAIRDPRVTVGGIWDAIKAMGDDAVELRQPMIERIAATDPSAPNPPRDIGRALSSLPPGIFANLIETERAILADPTRRVLAPGLISRQADRGAAAVPMLLGILDYHLREIAREKAQRNSGASDNMVPVDRVRMAFCLLGPEAASALPAIERLTAEGLVDSRIADGGDWHLMLARIGKPVGEIAKPKNRSGTAAQFHRNLQDRLDRFRPDRCGPQWS